jgi:hypothetical protein
MLRLREKLWYHGRGVALVLTPPNPPRAVGVASACGPASIVASGIHGVNIVNLITMTVSST